MMFGPPVGGQDEGLAGIATSAVEVLEFKTIFGFGG